MSPRTPPAEAPLCSVLVQVGDHDFVPCRLRHDHHGPCLPRLATPPVEAAPDDVRALVDHLADADAFEPTSEEAAMLASNPANIFAATATPPAPAASAGACPCCSSPDYQRGWRDRDAGIPVLEQRARDLGAAQAVSEVARLRARLAEVTEAARAYRIASRVMFGPGPWDLEAYHAADAALDALLPKEGT